MLDALEYLLETILPALVVFPVSKLVLYPHYSVPAILVSAMAAWFVLRVLRGPAGNYVAWGAAGSLLAVVAFAVRVALVLRDSSGPAPVPNFFTILYPTNWIYLWFALSGALCGTLFAFREPRRGSWRTAVLAGMALGVIVHGRIASGFWAKPFGPRAVLFVTETFAPALFGVLVAWLLDLAKRAYGKAAA